MATPPNAVKTSKSKALPILLAVVCGIVLAVGSCFGFLGTLRFNGGSNPWNAAFALGFVIGVAAFLFGCLWAFICFLRLIWRNKERS